ncbi:MULTISPECIES: hypothetical protein [unclassified Rhizobium]|uniref:DUF6894 family protein n=1 Tax=unclassified Rhizobium TaxID=2613769 RepID=UPI00160AABC0|nr:MULTISPECIES: hypothetical protein [unclassified Rhizobium]MBB3318179.1 hypothetical protein [Rhizobium sp. BK181]MBB3543755.1 hypothetical protein [Rhizobium sp. BK399]
MPRFYFNIVMSSGIQEDFEGTDLPTLDAARSEAIKDARSIMSNAILMGQDVSSRSVEIRDDAGDVVLSLPFRDTITRSE